MLVAPTERFPITNLGRTSSLPEQFGADILFPCNGAWVGVQRKEVNDLVASVHDGRLAREMSMLKRCSHAVLVVEGRCQWTMDGSLLTNGSGRFGVNWTKAQHRGLLWSVRQQGVWVEWTDSAEETVEVVQMLEGWMRKEKHTSLTRRPGPDTVWGVPTNRDYAKHLIMGLPGVGVETAEKILETLGVPFGWKVSKEELMTVKGIGARKAETLMKALG